jgi:hypothetical protein
MPIVKIDATALADHLRTIQDLEARVFFSTPRSDALDLGIPLDLERVNTINAPPKTDVVTIGAIRSTGPAILARTNFQPIMANGFYSLVDLSSSVDSSDRPLNLALMAILPGGVVLDQLRRIVDNPTNGIVIPSDPCAKCPIDGKGRIITTPVNGGGFGPICPKYPINGKGKINSGIADGSIVDGGLGPVCPKCPINGKGKINSGIADGSVVGGIDRVHGKPPIDRSVIGFSEYSDDRTLCPVHQKEEPDNTSLNDWLLEELEVVRQRKKHDRKDHKQRIVEQESLCGTKSCKVKSNASTYDWRKDRSDRD